MRTLTAAQSAVLEGENRSTNVRVRVDPGSGFVDLSTLEGRDWIVSVEYGGGTDMPLVTAAISVRRQAEQLNLAPLIDASKFNQDGALLNIGNDIVIDVAVIAQDQLPVEADFVEVFRGEIDDVEEGSDPIVLQCRDQGHLLVDTFIEVQRVYGSPGGTEIETVIQDILDDNINTPALGSVTLFSVNGTGGTPFNPADSPGFLITEYIQSKESTDAAIRRLAQMIGHDVKYRFHDNTSAFQFVFFQPDRAKPAQGALLFTAQPVDGETFNINGQAVTARAAAPGADEYLISSTLSGTMNNIAAALNAGSESANLFADQFTGDSVLIEWAFPGVAGNAIVFTEAIATATANGGGTLGGTQLGADGKTVPDFTFDKDHYFKIGRANIKRRDIRNVIRVTFADPADDNNRTTVVRSDAASITKFGRRFMEITEDSNSQIDTVDEAANFCGFALRDLSEPDLNQETDQPYFWPAEDADLYRYEANGHHYDTDQDLASVTYRHVLTKSSSRTAFAVRGKPGGGVNRWLDNEGNNLRNPAQDLFSNAAAAGMAVEADLGVIIITYDDPRTQTPPVTDWAYTECHISTTGGFTPSATTLKEKGRRTRFEIGGLVPGTTYFSKTVIIDELGNVASTSAQVTIATQRVGPYHENTDGQQDQLLRNNDFNIFTLGTAVPPDFWRAFTGVWDTDMNQVSATADTATGGNAIRFLVTPSINPQISSDPIPFTEGELVTVGAFAKSDVLEANTDFRIFAVWLDSAKALISFDTTILTVAQNVYEERATTILVAPANTRYVEIRLRGLSVAANTYSLDIDRVGAMRASVQARRTMATPSFCGGANVPVVVDFDQIEPEEVGISYATGVYTIDTPGQYVWSTSVQTTRSGSLAHDAEAAIEVSLAGGAFNIFVRQRLPSVVYAVPVGHRGLVVLTNNVIELDKGDRVRVRFQISNGIVLIDGVPAVFDCWVAAKLVEKNTK